ncbi:type II toxin-antitoxin system HicB family antitoxin [Methanosarcina sp. DH2]|nr:type II toxin-antitoxin system HicB family antitoxin [Methanosarcina sp. DH2]MCC4768846.1 type II toxin-antitoxin system HicB family antitoxin [Methanosarcina sp. DH2]
MTETFTFSAMVQKKNERYVSSCLELEISSQGKTIEEAVSNLKEAVELYIEREDITLPVKRPFLTTFRVTGNKTQSKRSTIKKKVQ